MVTTLHDSLSEIPMFRTEAINRSSLKSVATALSWALKIKTDNPALKKICPRDTVRVALATVITLVATVVQIGS